MRIRRSAKLSPALSTADGTCPEELLQAHVCRLSQSPWDIAIVAQSSANTQVSTVNGFTKYPKSSHVRVFFFVSALRSVETLARVSGSVFAHFRPHYC